MELEEIKNIPTIDELINNIEKILNSDKFTNIKSIMDEISKYRVNSLLNSKENSQLLITKKILGDDILTKLVHDYLLNGVDKDKLTNYIITSKMNYPILEFYYNNFSGSMIPQNAIISTDKDSIIYVKPVNGYWYRYIIDKSKQDILVIGKKYPVSEIPFKGIGTEKVILDSNKYDYDTKLCNSLSEANDYILKRINTLVKNPYYFSDLEFKEVVVDNNYGIGYIIFKNKKYVIFIYSTGNKYNAEVYELKLDDDLVGMSLGELISHKMVSHIENVDSSRLKKYFDNYVKGKF